MPCQLPAGRQEFAGPHSAIDDGAPQLAVNLPTQILSPDQTNVELHLASVYPDTQNNWTGRSGGNPREWVLTSFTISLTLLDKWLELIRLVSLSSWRVFYGCAMSFLLSSAVRILFPPATEQLLGANARALWLKQAGGSRRSPQGIIRVLKAISAIIALAAIGTWIAERSVTPKSGMVMLLVVLLAFFMLLQIRGSRPDSDRRKSMPKIRRARL